MAKLRASYFPMLLTLVAFTSCTKRVEHSLSSIDGIAGSPTGDNIDPGGGDLSEDGAWGSVQTDTTKPDHFVYNFKLCDNPVPSNGGSSCVVDAGYVLVAGSSPLREEKRTNACVNGYVLTGGQCVATEDGSWGPVQTDTTKPDHFVYNYKLCNNPAPSNGGSSCLVDDGYVLVAGSTPLREEQKTTSCVSGYVLTGGQCVAIQNGSWGPLQLDTSKPDHFVYNFKLCNNPAPSNGGASCDAEAGYVLVAGSSPLREEKKSNLCTAGFLNINGTCVKDILNGRTSMKVVVGGGTCRPQYVAGEYNTGCLSWDHWGVATSTGYCPAGTETRGTGYVSAGIDGFICLKTATLTATGWDTPLYIPVGGGNCRPIYHEGTSCGVSNDDSSTWTWQAYGAGFYEPENFRIGCPANTFQITTAQVMGGSTGFLCLTNSVQVDGQWSISSEFHNSSQLREIVGGRYCQPVPSGTTYGGEGCSGDWAAWGVGDESNYTSSGITGQVKGGPNGILFFK